MPMSGVPFSAAFAASYAEGGALGGRSHLLRFQWGKDSLKDKVRFELKGDFEEEAPWGSSHNCLPFPHANRVGELR